MNSAIRLKKGEKLFFSPYTLQGAWKRRGALLKIVGEQGTGYADLHSWPELGDAPLEEQLKKMGKTPLSKRALETARLDAQARTDQLSLLAGLVIPESHFLVTSDAIPEGWSHYKIKLQHLDLLSRIPPEAKVRIDCNGKLSAEEAATLIKKLDPERIDFIEDPCPYDKDTWHLLEERGIALAADRYKPMCCSIEVFKPAVDEKPSTNAAKLVVTSYLGHPLGQTAAAYYAGILSRSRDVAVCGLLSHLAYAPTPYSSRLSQKEPTFMIPSGAGFGFDDLLEQEEWHALRMDI